MYRINLIGEIIEGGGEGTINYSMLSDELDKANGEDLEIVINSIGGHVDEAFRIYNALEDYKLKNKAVITTITDENCASSGVILLLSGNRRIVNNNSNPFVHNAMYVEVTGNAKDLQYLADDLLKCDMQIAELYAKKTALSVDEALNLMGAEYYFTPEESYALGFSTELSKVYNKLNKSVKHIISNKLNINNQMSKEKTFFEMARNFFMGENQEENLAIQNKIEMTVSDAELDFYELDSDATPTIGDKATFEGKPAEGDFKMKNGKEYEFSGGVLNEIKEEVEEIEIIEENKAEELESQLNEAKIEIENSKKETETLKLEIQNLKSELETSKIKIEKFNKLESQFLAENKKEQRETIDVKQASRFDFSTTNEILKQIKNK